MNRLHKNAGPMNAMGTMDAISPSSNQNRTYRTNRLYRFLIPLPLAVTLVAAACGGSGAGTEHFTQIDRLARPAVNELFATVANNRHKTNNMIAPKDDSTQLATDVDFFMTHVAGRSQATADVVKAVLVPDVMVADMSQTTAAYLGVETGGATGGKFGGRALADDVIDISLGAVFGNTVSALGLAADDGHEIATLTSDNTDASGKHFSNTFPYLGAPQS